MSASSKYLYLLAGILLVFAWIEPNYYMPWKAFYNEFLAFLSLFLIFLADLNNKKRVSLLFICWCLFVLTLFAQMALGQFYFSSDALVAAIYIVCALISYQCGLNLEKRDVLFFISVVLLVGGGLNSVFAICQVFGVEYSFITGLSAHGRIFGNMAQPNNLSTLLCMSFLAATYLYWNQRLNVVVFVCIFLIIACVLTLTESRTPLIQLLSMALLIVCYRKKTEVRVLLPIVFVALFYFTYSMFPLLDRALSPVGEEVSGVRILSGTYSDRLDNWMFFARVVFEGPVFGYGWGQISVAQYENIVDLESRLLPVDYSHNIFLDLLLWMGPLCGLIVVSFFIFWSIRLLRKISDKDQLFLVLLLVVFSIHSMLELPHVYSFFMFFVLFILGVLDSFQGNFLKSEMPKFVTFPLVPIFLYFLLIFWGEYRLIEEDFRVMRAQHIGLPVAKDIDLSGDVFWLTGPRSLIEFGRFSPASEMSKDQISWASKVAARYPMPVVVYKYALCLSLNGMEQQARTELEKMRVLHGEKMYARHLELFNDQLDVASLKN